MHSQQCRCVETIKTLALCQVSPSHSPTDPMHHTQLNPVTSLAVVSCGEGQCSLDGYLVYGPPPVLFIYDYALTFAKEVDLFWLQPRQTWAFAFFIANRYIGLFGRIPVLLAFLSPNSGSPDSPVCLGLELVNEITTIVLQVIGGIIMITRVYAYYNRDRRILSLLLAVGLIGLGIFCRAFSFHTSEPTGIAPGTYAGCSHVTTSVKASYWAATWGGQLLLDTVVFTLTLKKLIRARSLGKWSYMALLLRDGVLYFAVMTAVNVANIVTYLVLADPYRAILSYPTNMLCAAMISRLMLNLRDLDHEVGLLCITHGMGMTRCVQLMVNYANGTVI
ncbi:hypothetical protein EDD15DRAFT_892657 [Pisolithus albus]|nr:hypothetical protein EDD15DRAFT_892657 [Pisolithus albus]